MANPNAKALINGIPSCVSGCFQNGVEATGCNTTDYDCYCYKNNHQTIVDTMYICLDNRENKLGKNCTEDEMFQMENRYWMVCEQYWEPTGTASDPASATATTKTKSISASLSLFTTTTTPPTTIDSEAAARTETVSPSDLADSHAKLSSGAQVGIGIGAALAAILIAAAAFLWMRERKKRRQLEEQLTQVNEAPANTAYYKEKSVIHEMEGDRPYVPELRGNMRTPELTGAPRIHDHDEGITSTRKASTVSADSTTLSPGTRHVSPRVSDGSR